jgi:6-phosphogluconolactonase
VGSPFAVPGLATLTNLAMHPSGKYLYGVDTYFESPLTDFATVFAFGLDNSTGAITGVLQSTDTDWAHGIAMHPSGDFFFVTQTLDSGLGSFVVNPADGTFTPEAGNPYSDPGDNVWGRVTPDGKYLYTSDASLDHGGEINGFLINSTTGELTGLDGFPVTDANSGDQRSLLVEPSGTYLYVLNWDTDDVSAYEINSSTGALSEITGAGSPFSAGDRPKALATDRQGDYLYVVDYGAGDVNAYSITPGTGALTLFDTYPVGAGPKAIITVP